MEVLAEGTPDGRAAAGGMRSALQLAFERVVPRHNETTDMLLMGVTNPVSIASQMTRIDPVAVTVSPEMIASQFMHHHCSLTVISRSWL